MALPHRDDLPAPFPLVRYYTAASVLVIMVAVVVVNLISARVERATVIERLRQESIEAAQPVTFVLAEQLSLRAGEMGAHSELVATNDRDWMDRTVLNAVRGQRILRFDMLLPDGTLLYSTDREALMHIKHDSSLDGAVEKTVRAGLTSEYAGNVSLNLLSGDTGTFDVVETFIPVYPEGSSGARAAAPYAVFAFYRDVTASVEAATASAARFRLTTVVTTMGLMFLALLVIVARGQKFTNAIRQRLAEELMMERELAEQLDTQNAKLKETNEKLREASEARSRFLSTASHELRTPLTTMLAFTDILRRNHEGTLTPRQLQQLDAVRRGGGQLKLLIEDLLDMSRIDAGTLRLEPTRFPMALVLQEVAESMSPIFADKRQRFELELPPADAYVFADRARIVQVVSNLLSNASKYTHEDASVTLRGEARDGAVYVSVKDTGIGISDEDQKHLFQLFFRADNPETRRVQGSGLGLTIVRSIVELHGGSVSVQSKRGQGSTFSFWLPVASGAGGAGHMQTSQEPADAMRPGEATPAAA